MSSSGNLIVERQGTAKSAGGPGLARVLAAVRPPAAGCFFLRPVIPGGGLFFFLRVPALFLLLFVLLFFFVLFFPAVFPPCLSQPF